MKISYIEKFSGREDEEPKAKAFESLGVEVERIEEHMFPDVKYYDTNRPDIVLWAKLKINPEIRGKLLKRLKSLDVKTATWVPDLYWGLAREWSIRAGDPVFRADTVFTPDGGNDEKWKREKINHKLLRQGIGEESCFEGNLVSDAPEIVFVGTSNGEYVYRDMLMKFLKETYGDRFGWLGHNSNTKIRGKALNDLYRSSKIVIGDSVYSPHYWSNRIYEVLGRAGFLIHPMIPGLSEEYTPYKHFVPYQFNDFDGLKEKIDYYLRHPMDRDQIRHAAMAHTLNHHTLKHRCKSFLEQI